MIKSFADPEAEKIWNGERSRKLQHTIQNAARRKLRMINNSTTLNDLRIPPANRLEKLKGDLKGFLQHQNKRSMANHIYMDQRRC